MSLGTPQNSAIQKLSIIIIVKCNGKENRSGSESNRRRPFTRWAQRLDTHNAACNFGFAISVCRLRERGRMSKSVYVRVFHDLELLSYVLRCVIERQL